MATFIAYFMHAMMISRLMGGLKVGLICGIAFAGMSTWQSHLWEARPFSLTMIVGGHQAVEITLIDVVLGFWG